VKCRSCQRQTAYVPSGLCPKCIVQNSKEAIARNTDQSLSDHIEFIIKQLEYVDKLKSFRTWGLESGGMTNLSITIDTLTEFAISLNE